MRRILVQLGSDDSNGHRSVPDGAPFEIQRRPPAVPGDNIVMTTERLVPTGDLAVVDGLVGPVWVPASKLDDWNTTHHSADDEPPSFTCPVCVMTSFSPMDLLYGYCGNCHAFTR